MPQITDVSPTRSNINASNIGHSVTGRMLSIACTPDDQTLYAGSYSNIWESSDGGQNFEQLTWPQPDPTQFVSPGAIGGWCVVDLAAVNGWRVEKHPRVLAQLTNKPGLPGHMDIVGFGDSGVWTALGDGAGGFKPANVVINNFGFQAGGWQVDKHPRFVADLTGDGCGDLVGFGDAGVWTALGNGDGTFQAPKFVLANFGYSQGWRVENHPRFVVDLNGDGHADIVGFGDAGVWTAMGDGHGGFGPAQFVLANFGYNQGWRVESHPRFIAKLRKGNFLDIVGFGDAGVWTAQGTTGGGFGSANYVLANFGLEQGWQVEKHPRLVADLNGNGIADIVGFGDAGVWTSMGDGNGGFGAAQFVMANLGYNQGWRTELHPRFVTRLTNSGFADIVGFGDAGVWTALGTAGGFAAANYVLANLGVQQGWQVSRHPRLVGNLTSSGHGDIVGFGDAGVWTALGDGHGGFPTSNYVQANFGFGNIVLALVVNDLVAGGRGVWRTTDGGTNWVKVHQFPSATNLGQIQWALGSDHLVYVAGGSSLAISKDAGATFVDVFPWGVNPAAKVNHVAVWQNSPSDPFPAVIYALGDTTMFLSFDGGTTWMKDKGALPKKVGGLANHVANFNSPTMMVISPRFVLEVYVAQNGSSGPDNVYRGDYSHFPFGDQTSSWEPLPLPDLLNATDTQDAGNVFLMTTPRNSGDLLYYGAQRFFQNTSQAVAYVGPLHPASGADWHTLGTVHVDLHGFLLSPDFSASIQNGKYQKGTGTAWILSDGGVYHSSDGGQNFTPTQKAMTLSCMSVAGVSVQGKGPALSLNSGDNDGFYSMDGGHSWSYQQYGGGDNDCAFADPLRSHAIMVFTPRWDSAGNGTSARLGSTVSVYQTNPGSLPNAATGGHDRKAVTGPPTLNPNDASRPIWNGSSGFAELGSQPIVLGLPGEVAPAQGDYIFILNPSLANPQLVRTQNIFDIKHREEWLTTATGPGQGANVFLQGPPLPNAGLGVVQASGGHSRTMFYVGGDNTLWSWASGAPAWSKLVPAAANSRSVGANAAVRFFANPYTPSVVYILDTDHIKRSNDGGHTWQVDVALETQLTWNHQIAISSNDDPSGIGEHFDLILTDMKFDPNNPLLRFAVGIGGAFMTRDGVNWTRLLHSGGLPGRPSTCYYDKFSNPSDPALYVSFAGRSLLKISSLP